MSKRRQRGSTPAATGSSQSSPGRASGGRSNSDRIAGLNHRTRAPKPKMGAGIRANAERSLGAGLGGVDVVADGQAEQLGHAAFTQGNTIHVHDAAVGPSGDVEPNLLAHELTHNIHQQQVGDGSTNMEAEADAGRQAILRGQRFDVQGGTAGQQVLQPWGLTEWFRDVFGPGDATDAANQTGDLSYGQAVRQGSSTQVTDHHDGTSRTPRTHYGTGAPIADADGLDDRGNRAVNETQRTGGMLHSTNETMTPWGYSSSEDMTSYSPVAADGSYREVGATRTGAVDLSQGRVSTGQSARDLTTEIDHDASATRVQRALRDRAAGIQVQLTEADQHIGRVDTAIRSAQDAQDARRAAYRQQLEADGGSPSAAEVWELVRQDPEFQRHKAAEDGLRRDRSALAQDRAGLVSARDAATTAADGVTAENAMQVAAAQNVQVEAATRQVGLEASQSTTRDVDILAGNYTRTDQSSATLRDAQGSETTTRTDATRWGVNGGLSRTQTGTDREQIVLDSDNGTDVTHSESTSHGLAVRGNGEYGYSRGRTVSDSQNITLGGERSNLSTERNSNVTVTNRGVYGDGSATGTAEGDHLRGQARVSANGRFTVNVTQTSTAPPKWQLEVTVAAGAGINGELGRASARPGQTQRGTASATAGASGSASLVFRHEMDRTEASHYLDELSRSEAGGQTSGGRAEFDLLDRMHALGDQLGEGDAATAMSVFDSGFSNSVTPGDSYELTLEGNANVGGTAGANGGGLGVTGGANASWQRTRRVTVSARQDVTRGRLVVLKVEFAGKDGWGANAGMTYGAAGMSGGYSEQDTSGVSQTFTLDPNMPDYDAVYDRIIGVGTRNGLSALGNDPDISRHRTGHTVSAGESATSNVGMSVGPVGLNLSSTNAYDESVSVNDGNLSGTFTGSETVGGNVELGGVRLHEDSQNTSGTAGVDAAGNMSVTLSQTNTSNSVLNLGDENQIAGPSQSMLERMLGQAPEQTLEREIRRTLTSIWGFTLDENAVDTLVGRASNRSRWGDCANWQGIDDINAWSGLRTRLLRPRPEAEWTAVNETRALKLARCRSIASFMQSAGSAGMACMRNCLRFWGETMMDYGSRADDAGLMFEWPSGLMLTRPKYNRVVREHGTAESQTQAWMSGTAEQSSEGRTSLHAQFGRAQEVRLAVQAYNGFAYPRAKHEMIAHIDEMATDLLSWMSQLSHGEENGTCMPEGDIAQHRATARKPQLERELRHMKLEERRLLDLAHSATYEGQDGFFDTLGWTFGVGVPDQDDYIYLSRCSDLQEFWIHQIKELRTTYETLGTPTSEWMVSTGPRAERNYRYEPEYERLNELTLRCARDRWLANQEVRRRENALNAY